MSARRWRYEMVGEWGMNEVPTYRVLSTDPVGGGDDMLAFTITLGRLLANSPDGAENAVRFITDAMNLHAL